MKKSKKQKPKVNHFKTVEIVQRVVKAALKILGSLNIDSLEAASDDGVLTYKSHSKKSKKKSAKKKTVKK